MKLPDDCKQMAVRIASELTRRPLYIRDARDFDGLPSNGPCLGWAHDSATTVWPLAHAVGGDWQGPGPIIAIDLAAIANNALPNAFEQHVRSVVIHEIAHVLPPPTPLADFPHSHGLAARQLELLEAAAQKPEPEPNADPFHNLSFIRRCCHLYYRAVVLGYGVMPHAMFVSEPWLSRLEIYFAHAIGECARMREATFHEIESLPIPAALSDQWHRDLRFYEQNFLTGPGGPPLAQIVGQELISARLLRYILPR
jgi:hypothetical protein